MDKLKAIEMIMLAMEGYPKFANPVKLDMVVKHILKQVRKDTLKELILECENNRLDGKGYDFHFSINDKINELN